MPLLKGKSPWNKGLKIGETHPQMGFQKGNTYNLSPNSIVTRFKKGVSVSPNTQFKKGMKSWNKGKKGTFKHTEEWKRQRSEAMKGSNHPLWREYPELRYEINNGITLCHAHHPRKRAEEKRLIPTFKELVSVSNELPLT